MIINQYTKVLEIVWTDPDPLTPTLSPDPGGEGRVRGAMFVKTNMGTFINHLGYISQHD